MFDLRSLPLLAASLFVGLACASAKTPAAGPTLVVHYTMPMPTYPHQAMGGRIEGTGTVQVTFDKKGNPKHVKMVQTTGSIILDRSTVLFVQQNWKSTSGVSTTKTVVVEYRMPAPLPAKGKRAPAQMMPEGKGFFTPKPPYPREALYARVMGVTRLQITSDQYGKIVRTKVVQSSGDAALDGCASDWVKLYWRFPPGKPITHETEFDYRLYY